MCDVRELICGSGNEFDCGEVVAKESLLYSNSESSPPTGDIDSRSELIKPLSFFSSIIIKSLELLVFPTNSDVPAIE